ncbi:MerR family transcriptional regulator [Lactococcus lactis]|uniref:MerR family transcriptional regulator n=1 Tax=Lactococcus lactis TaxID=1358 RepID=UPI001F531F88|nr:MerR family transcriptional regulator [Lactococcus lactis]MCI1072195.1 MerR family transcriptional regulator [Lactococcus lactis]MCQ4970720.1 MerR family transcriptional regulator [Lactococcus lactis]MCQ4996528.1 MerR family transcriptional regulator [Lactococcus lactis]
MYTINDVSKLFSISPHTLRFYAQKGLFPNITRNEQNTRIFSDKDLEYVEMVIALRHTGMSIASIKKYINLCIQGNDTVKKRQIIIQSEFEKAEHKVIESLRQRDILKSKLSYYQKAIDIGEENITWSTNRNF